MRTVSSITSTLTFLAALVVACHGEPADDGAKAGPGAIVNGTLDRAHGAVVALFSGKGSQTTLCSGTIVKKDASRRVAWIATAAHCVEHAPTVAFLTKDFASKDSLRLEVIDYAADPEYSGPDRYVHDFAVVLVAGADATTPVLPLAHAADDLRLGSLVMSIGFGRTSVDEPTEANRNTRRHAVEKTLGVVTDDHLGYDMATRGICMGDSGGPVITGAGDAERVVGIHSFVQDGCDGKGFSGRVATAGAGFFESALAKALPSPSCGLCSKIASSGTNECAVSAAACLADPQCSGFNKCLGEGKTATQCARRFPFGEGPYRTAASCACVRACASECASDAKCEPIPKCGVKLKDRTCGACVEASCCQAAADCTADGPCYACLRGNDLDPMCAVNEHRLRLAECLGTSCAEACDAQDAAPAVTPSLTSPSKQEGDALGASSPASAVPSSDESDGEEALPEQETLVRRSASCASAPLRSTAGEPWTEAALAIGALAAVRRRRRLRHG